MSAAIEASDSARACPSQIMQRRRFSSPWALFSRNGSDKRSSEAETASAETDTKRKKNIVISGATHVAQRRMRIPRVPCIPQHLSINARPSPVQILCSDFRGWSIPPR